MRIVKRLITCFFFLVSLATLCHAQGWRGIVPLHSTRQDVERAIGRPTESNQLTYNLITERVTILYSDGPCVKGWPYGWNVTSDVVTKIIVHPQTKVTVDQLGIDITGYSKTRNTRLGGMDYRNTDIGISIGVKPNGDVDVVQYDPSLKDQDLLCPDAAKRQREIESGESAYVHPIVHYSDLSLKEETARLGFFATQAKKYPPESTIYVIGYAGPEECSDRGLIRANRVRERLPTEMLIDRERIVPVDGGHKNGVWIELYVIRPGAPRPLSTPDISPALAKNANCSSAKP